MVRGRGFFPWGFSIYPDRLGPSGKSVDNSTKQTCLEISDYRIKHSTVLTASKASNQAWSKSLDIGFVLFLALQPPVGQSLFIDEISTSHTTKHHSRQTPLDEWSVNSRTSHCQCSLFSEKNPIIRIFCLSGWFAVAIIPDQWSSTVYACIHHICLQWSYNGDGLSMCNLCVLQAVDLKVNSALICSGNKGRISRRVTFVLPVLFEDDDSIERTIKMTHTLE
jgi:hypothetical protein